MKNSSLKYYGNIQDSVAVTDISTIEFEAKKHERVSTVYGNQVMRPPHSIISNGDEIDSTGRKKLYGELFGKINGKQNYALAA